MKTETVEINTNGINYIISHNQVLTVPKITEKDIKDGGKFCTGTDSYTGETVKILDKDYGKSAELMRALLEPKNKNNNKWLYIIFGTIFFIILIVTLLIINGNSQQIKKVQNTGIVPKETKIETKVQNTGIIPKETKIETKVQNIDPDNIIKEYKANFEREKLDLEYSKLNDEYLKILAENHELKVQNEELQEKLNIINEKPKNLTSTGFIMYLGNIIYKKCDKPLNESEKSKCESLYYNYVKND